MSDELTGQPTESEPVQLYPQNRFAVFLAILVVLLSLFAIAQRGPRPVTEGAGFSENVLQGDIYMKSAYASEKWAGLVVGAGQKQQFGALHDTQRMLAATMYRQAIREEPAASTLRRLIISGTPSDRPQAIDQLASLHKPGKKPKPDAAMWRRIYLSKAPLSPSEVRADESRIRSLHLGWFKWLALADLYDRAGMKGQADKARAAAGESASRSIILFGVMALMMLLLGLMGFGLFLWYLSAKSSGRLVPIEPAVADTESARSFIAGFLLESFVVYLTITLGIQVAAAGLLYLHPAIDKSSVAVFLTFGVYVTAGILSLVYLAYRIRKAGFSWRTIGFGSQNPLADIGWGIGGYAVCLPLLITTGVMSRVIGRYIRTPSNPIVPLFVQSPTAFARMVIFVLAAVAAPFFEELFFRGALYHSFEAKWGLRLGVILSAVVFALVHPFPFDFLPILALGSVFAVLAHQRGSLLPSMVAHALNNTMSFIMLLILVGS